MLQAISRCFEQSSKSKQDSGKSQRLVNRVCKSINSNESTWNVCLAVEIVWQGKREREQIYCCIKIWMRVLLFSTQAPRYKCWLKKLRSALICPQVVRDKSEKNFWHWGEYWVHLITLCLSIWEFPLWVLSWRKLQATSSWFITCHIQKVSHLMITLTLQSLVPCASFPIGQMLVPAQITLLSY